MIYGLTNSECNYLKTIYNSIDAKLTSECGSDKPISLIAIKTDKLYLIQAALLEFIENHERGHRCIESNTLNQNQRNGKNYDKI